MIENVKSITSIYAGASCYNNLNGCTNAFGLSFNKLFVRNTSNVFLISAVITSIPYNEALRNLIFLF